MTADKRHLKIVTPDSPAPESPPAADAPAPRPPAEAGQHPYGDLDRMARALMARYTGGVSPYSVLAAWSDWALHLSRSPGRQTELAEKAFRDAWLVFAYAVQEAFHPGGAPPFSPKDFDHRFTHPGWDSMPFAAWRQAFLAAQDWWDQATDNLRGVQHLDSERVRFMVRQLLDLASPSNFPALNPEIIEQTVTSGGQNIFRGFRQYAEDLVHILTQMRKNPPEGYELGKDLARTPGKVVFRNDLFELLQYEPTTQKVRSEPILIVPAWIMKYYILDLSAQNSMIAHLVDQGFTVFAMSWRNPTAEQAGLSLEDYRRRGVMAAMDAVGAIVPGRKIHATGYCLGGTILAIAAATMARDGDERLASVTLLAAQVDFSEAGELLLFLDESQVAFLEDMMWAQGYLDRPQMARTFATIRAEDLIYARAVRRYFLGKPDLSSDLSVWSSDTTRMPARMHSEYLRGLFLENRLTAGRFAVEGKVIALKDLAAPLFVVGTESDHIAPWKSVYKIRLFTDCDLTFVLTSGGHNSGIVNPPDHARGHYHLGVRPENALYVDPDTWRAGQQPVEGSWWTPWTAWLAAQSTGMAAPPEMGNAAAGYAPIMAAPGSYVHQS